MNSPVWLVILLCAAPAAAEESASRVRITQGPEIEQARSDFAIVRWTTTTPTGSPVHEGIVRYGTEPTKLSETARSPIRLNPSHPQTIFRVRVEGLRPRTTYYYNVDSAGADGKSDRVKCAVKQFTTP
ncbi:MAG: hypothetical protein JWP87_656 [Labilithrix sp.]|nr:hypothetical protein [Labilithrix sp.]